MRAALLTTILCLVAIRPAHAQSCPTENPEGPNIESASRTLSGKIIYHDQIRQWFGLLLDSPVCGEQEIQLLQGGGAFEVDESNARSLETFRGCRATVEGSLGIPGTGYYSAEIYQNVDKIEPAVGCIRQPLFPDYSKLKPSKSLRIYRVSMWFDYTKPDSRIHVAITDGIRALRPWQPYASYWLTGGFVFYGYCADGFDLVNFSGTPEANPWLVDNYIALDPEGAAQKHVDRIELAYTCRRE